MRTRAGVGAGRAAHVEPVAPVQREPRAVTVTEGITVRELAEKLDIRAKELLKTLARPRRFRQHQPGARRADGDEPGRVVQRNRAGGDVRRAAGPGRKDRGRADRKCAAARSRGDRDGPRGPRQDQPARRHPRNGSRRRRSGRNHAAYRRVRSARRATAASCSSIRRATRRSRACARAARR